MTALEEDHFDSEFEREVCQRLRAQGLRVTPQFPVAGYRIDLVVEDNEGRRLGVECDGTFHYDELGQLREEDYERQEIIERGGWAIYRIPSRRFHLDPEREITFAVRVLQEQVTDAESVVKDFEDFSRISPQVEEEIHAQPVGEPEIGLIRELPEKRLSYENWFEPSFDSPEPWIRAARWGNLTGKLNYSNRVFLWQIGDKIRKNQNLEDAEKTRGSDIWCLLLKEGFRPFAEGVEAP
ncbi:MAG: DUF559 domain-containing protein [Acidobacteria bacterium]|nr:DUF559 domain-containing protein [Acidobacteriota bacterium]